MLVFEGIWEVMTTTDRQVMVDEFHGTGRKSGFPFDPKNCYDGILRRIIWDNCLRLSYNGPPEIRRVWDKDGMRRARRGCLKSSTSYHPVALNSFSIVDHGKLSTLSHQYRPQRMIPRLGLIRDPRLNKCERWEVQGRCILSPGTILSRSFSPQINTLLLSSIFLDRIFLWNPPANLSIPDFGAEFGSTSI